MYFVKGSEYPNGELRAVVYTLPSVPFSYDETHETYLENGETILSRELFQAEEEECSLLDIGSKLETPQEKADVLQKPGWGILPKARRFSRYAKRVLMRAGGVFRRDGLSPKNCLFLTGTIPGSTEAAFETVARYSAFLVHGLKAWINKHIPSKFDFYVWEHQKRGALHLHYCVYTPDAVARKFVCENFPKQWINLLKRVSVKAGEDIFDTGRGYSWLPREAEKHQYAQTVEKDVSAYLAKYCSKNAGAKRDGESTKFYSPSRWYGVSRPLLKKLRELSVEKIYAFASKRQALKLYEDMLGFIANVSDRCYEYMCHVTGLPAFVAFNSHYSMEKLCLMTHPENSQPTKDSKTTLKRSEWINGVLRSLMMKYSITPYLLSKNSSSVAVLAGEKLLGSMSLSILETMELIHAVRWSLWYRYRDRQQPSELPKVLAGLDDTYKRILTLKIQAMMTGTEPITDLDNFTVDCKDL